MITNLATISKIIANNPSKKKEVIIRTKPEIAAKINKMLMELME